MRTKIYTLIDFSPYSETLLKACNEWAELFKAELIAIHEISFSSPAMSNKEARNQILLSEKESHLEKLKNYCTPIIKENISINYEVTEKSVVEHIKKIASPYKKNIVLVGMKGANYLKEVFLGSTTKKVINEVNEIIITLPKEINNFKPEKLIISINPEIKINLLKLKDFVTLFSKSIKNIEFVSFCEDIEDNLKLLSIEKDIKAILGDSFNYKEKSFDSLEQLKTYTMSDKKAMLLFQRGSRKTFDDLFRSFYINKFIEGASAPVVVIP